MLDKLYGHTDDSKAEQVDRRDVELTFRADYAKKMFEEQIRARRELDSNYCIYFFMYILTNYCCCLRCCWVKSKCLNKHVMKHQKF